MFVKIYLFIKNLTEFRKTVETGRGGYAPKSVPHVIREYGNWLITGLLCMATVLYRIGRISVSDLKLRGQNYEAYVCYEAFQGG